ncbi:fasciclin domain-containing protein [Ferruginibacter profundus]
MRILSHKFLIVCLFAFIATAVFTGCEKDDTPAVTETENLDTKIAANTDLTLFQYALKKTRLNTFTQGGGPFTLFAPTNAAFGAIGITNEAGINALDSNLLVQILTYHIQANARTYVEIPLGPNATMSTQGGYTQYASRYIGGSAYVNGAKIITADVKATNGVMHIIDRVLIPPYYNALVNMTAVPDYARMVQAINKTAITSTFTGGTATIFAVPNSVMVAAGYDSTTIANLVPASAPYVLLSNILKYHVVPQRIFSPDFKAGNLKTVQGTTVAVSFSGTTINIKGTTNAAPFQLTSGNLACSNGVLHSINGLLKY